MNFPDLVELQSCRVVEWGSGKVVVIGKVNDY